MLSQSDICQHCGKQFSYLLPAFLLTLWIALCAIFWGVVVYMFVKAGCVKG